MPIDTILAIDTSCDETSVAVTHRRRVISNVLSSQVELHKKYGGVFPTDAKRAHQEKIDHVVNEALTRSHLNLEQIDAIAVTQGPGLAPALEVGIAKAKELAKQFQKPLIAVNHMQGHLLSPLAQNSKGISSIDFDETNSSNFPALSLLASGGHTELVVIKKIGDYTVIGRTRDDAAGEAYDKVARMLGLGYPGGEIIELLAKQGNSQAFDFPIPMAPEPGLDFSFSGLKTAVMYQLKSLQHTSTKQTQTGGQAFLDKQIICDVAASFQRVLIHSLIIKTKRAVKKIQPKAVWLGGGVGANTQLRSQLRHMLQPFKLKLYAPYPKKLYTDNAAMIGIAAWYQAQRGEFITDIDSLDRKPNLDL